MNNGGPLRILVAGAGGVLGRAVIDALRERGAWIRAGTRRPHPELAARIDDTHLGDALAPDAWRGACDGIDVVFSSLGASVDPSPLVGWRSYSRVDAPANRALLAEAQRAGVRRFVYVSLIDGAGERGLDYAEGHERVVDSLRASGMACSILRPTGFFAAMTVLVAFARRGFVPVFGDGRCETNPVDERDLAAIAAREALSDGPGLREVEIGGPEVFTRRRIAEMACEALGRRPRLLHVPPALARLIGHGTRLLNPRAGHFTLFATHVMTHDCLAPKLGTRRLVDAFREAAARS